MANKGKRIPDLSGNTEGVFLRGNVEDHAATDGYLITPSDSVDEAIPFRSIYVGGAGNINVVKTDGTTLLFSGAVAGDVIPMQGRRVNTTSTTATLLIGLL